MMKRFISCVIIALSAFSAKAEIVLPRILGHGMVLQRNKPLPVWGTAAAGERVSVQFKGQERKTVADAAGNWKVVLDPLEASAVPASLTITGTNTVQLNDILVGEVWLCSGQSNMEYTMRKNSKITRRPAIEPNPVDELQYAKNPNIRIFLVNRKELAKPDPRHKGWSVARDSALRSFSAAAYFFAKEVNGKLNVPVGMISSAIPGSALEPWVSAEAFSQSRYFKDEKVGNDPGKFYEPMIKPLVPFALAGFLWYQGETNCFLNERITYTQKMEVLINSWRKAWSDEKMPFYYVQIAPFKYSESKGKIQLTKEALPEFREAQAMALKIPNTGMIETTDLVDNLDDIHPGFKWEIGRRLALVALYKTYGFKDLVASGPVFKKMKVKGRKAHLSFASSGSGLISKDGKPLTGFIIAGKDGKFVTATAEIKRDKLVLSSATVNKPVAVRFAWEETAQPNFYNKEGLPAQPFRTDNPLIKQYSYSKQ
ncbi:sialate O-acetylesterase [Pedobacter sp. SYSU D00535]|uniref:sialate O-acetylesterase n=1 Tax=Pedobacter sp. SYSU D00535 TaxID=2810308 RepID=UPI001F620391|nr:sialate O-acetylesterase [Pedobacter sp. SYSU D00535]